MYLWFSSQFCKQGGAPYIKPILRVRKWMDKGVGDMLSSTQVEKVDISAQTDTDF